MGGLTAPHANTSTHQCLSQEPTGVTSEQSAHVPQSTPFPQACDLKGLSLEACGLTSERGARFLRVCRLASVVCSAQHLVGVRSQSIWINASVNGMLPVINYLQFLTAGGQQDQVDQVDPGGRCSALIHVPSIN